MKPWIVAIIFGTFGKFFNNPNSIYKLEDRLANSTPIRELARTIVALFQRGTWELKQLKSIMEQQKQLGSQPLSDVQEDALRKLKKFEEELKRRMQGKM